MTSTTYKRHAERMRTCFAHVFGEAATGLWDDLGRFLTPCRDHGVPWEHRECLTTVTRGSRFDAHLQTSDVASHNSWTCVTTLRRSVSRCRLSRSSAQQHSHPLVADSIVKQTESSLPKPFPREDWTSLDKAPHKAAEESSVVMARRSQKEKKRSEGCSWVFMCLVMSTLHLPRTERVRIEG